MCPSGRGSSVTSVKFPQNVIIGRRTGPTRALNGPHANIAGAALKATRGTGSSLTAGLMARKLVPIMGRHDG